ncbi:MAG: matrixin family metalloprotease [Thermoleophilaceae bacterium]|nr:matrixin family metalloprotease [Thermoleophilaceae bacterium]
MATAPPATSAQNERGPSAKARASEQASQSIPIRYYNAAPRSAEFVDRAVRAWNRALVGSHFRAVPRRDARVVIRAARPSERCGGLARIRGARTSRRRDTLLRYGYHTSAVVTLGEICPPAVRALVATHELGHVLGLNHERRRCSVMSPKGEVVNGTLNPYPGCSPDLWAMLTRELVTDSDLRAARALYPKPADAGVTPRSRTTPRSESSAGQRSASPAPPFSPRSSGSCADEPRAPEKCPTAGQPKRASAPSAARLAQPRRVDDLPRAAAHALE